MSDTNTYNKKKIHKMEWSIELLEGLNMLDGTYLTLISDVDRDR